MEMELYKPMNSNVLKWAYNLWYLEIGNIQMYLCPLKWKALLLKVNTCTGIDIMLSNLTKTAIQRLVHWCFYFSWYSIHVIIFDTIS